jgi:hypothetical protein
MAPQSTRLTGCGPPIPGSTIRLVSPTNRMISIATTETACAMIRISTSPFRRIRSPACVEAYAQQQAHLHY